MEKEKKSGSKKTKIIIAIILILVIIASAVGGYFIYQYTEGQKPIEQGWANTYYNYIKKDSNGNIQDNSKLSFIEVKNIQEPVMLVEYNKENKTNTDIYYINDGTVKNIIDLGITDVELLYDISNQKYDWYTHKETESADIYKKVSSQIAGETTEPENTVENTITNNTEPTNTTESTNTANSTEPANTAESTNPTANSTEPANATENSNTTNTTESTNATETDGEYTFAKGEEITEAKTDGSKISIPKFDTIFVKADTDLDKIDYKKDMEDKELKTAIAEGANKYKTEDEIITDEIKAETAQKVTEVEQKKQEMETAKAEKEKAEEEAMKITAENIQTKIGEHLKYASCVYLGSYYGLPTVYKTNDVTGKVTIPGASEEMMVYEVVGLKSIQSLKDQMATYMTSEAITKLRKSQFSSYTEGLKEYNGKVYLVRGGIGDGPVVDTKKAKVLSSEKGITKVQLTDIDSLGDIVEATITLTIEYNKETGKYMITDCTINNKY